MHLGESVLVLGVVYCIVSGALNGVFTLPMRFLGAWSWENVWGLAILVSCVILPVAMVWIGAPEFLGVLDASPSRAVIAACVCGFAWGFGSIMFGQGVSAIGISMGNTLVLAVSASFGSILPIVVLAPGRFFHAQGLAIVAGTIIGIVGIVCFGYAGFHREESQKGRTQETRGDMVGHAKPFSVGLLLCIGSGLLSAVFNIGYSLAQPIRPTAMHMGHIGFAGTIIIWLLMLTLGAVPNLIFCAYLCTKNGTWKKFAAPGATRCYILAASMGALWWGSTYLYGFASPKLGQLGPAIGWSLMLMTALITVNVCGFLVGEWKLTRLRDRQWLGLGLLITLAAIAVLSWSSTLG